MKTFFLEFLLCPHAHTEFDSLLLLLHFASGERKAEDFFNLVKIERGFFSFCVFVVVDKTSVDDIFVVVKI